MHRVELKERNIKDFAKLNKLFLMHRVELKVETYHCWHPAKISVPNAPCGVERRL